VPEKQPQKSSSVCEYGTLGDSQKIKDLRKLIELLGPYPSPVLIIGERGTGKENIARKLHRLCGRGSYNFIYVDEGILSSDMPSAYIFGYASNASSALSGESPGKIGLAEKGTIYFDDISYASLEVQLMLIRALRENEYWPIGSNNLIKCDVRVIASSCVDLINLVNQHKFNPELYHRLRVSELRVPSLREHKEDIPILAKHFVAKHSSALINRSVKIDDGALNALLDYDWPGNIRELETLIVDLVTKQDSNIINSTMIRSYITGQTI
jgi:DNA-binding NtrC family response regulator